MKYVVTLYEMLSLLKKYMLLSIPCLALTSGIVSGQDAFYKSRHQFTIGFRTGREVLFHSLLTSRKEVRPRNELIIRKAINNHFRVESGLIYSSIPNGTSIKGLDKKNVIKTSKPSVAVPVTLQYNFIPARSRVSAYCGAGVQCNISGQPNVLPPFSSSLHPDGKLLAGTKYINVLITQGITFQINTRIQLNQSFHFIPGTDTAFGINLGIGYDIR